MKRLALPLFVLCLGLSACGDKSVPFGLRLFDRPTAGMDRLPSLVERTDPLLGGGAARVVGTLGDDRYWAVRYSNQVCIVGVPVVRRHGIGLGEACEPVADLRRGPLISTADGSAGTEVVGVVRDGYDEVRIEGVRAPVPVRANVFRATTRVGQPRITVSGPRVPARTYGGHVHRLRG